MYSDNENHENLKLSAHCEFCAVIYRPDDGG
jgi:hypothetical protein